MPCSAAVRGTALLIGWSAACVIAAAADQPAKPRRIDPAGWGSDHVGKPTPDYLTGDECLFCHRKLGPVWLGNPHQLTIRPRQPAEPSIKTLRTLVKGRRFADETQYLLGSRRITRFLKRSKAYGKLQMLSTAYVPARQARGNPGAGVLKNTKSGRWDRRTFGKRCAGCHATAVNTKTRAFSALSIDCFACHGVVELEHTRDISRVLLSSRSREPRRLVSICGQCHLRGGKSKSSRLPYPNTFVPGDNLFRDFRVDFSDAAIRALSAADQHIYINVRDVAVFGRSAITCLSCHDVHGQRSEKHQVETRCCRRAGRVLTAACATTRSVRYHGRVLRGSLNLSF